MLEGSLIAIERLAGNYRMFWFKPEKKLDYIAGQFVQIELPHEEADTRGHKRWFTLASSPSEELVSICTNVPDSSSSFKNHLNRLKPGDKVKISQAMGDFVLPMTNVQPLIFIAAGVGISPFRSMVKWLMDSGVSKRISLLQIAKNKQSVLFAELFDKTQIEYMKFFREDYDSRAQLKYEVVKQTMEHYSNDTDSLIYLAGPEKQVKIYRNKLSEAGVDEASLLMDYFLGLED